MIIIPSTPRLSTPARSTTTSPTAASRSGVDAASTARMMDSRSPISCLAMTRDEPEPVKDEGIARQHVEQENALEYFGQGQGDALVKWGRVPYDEREPQKQHCNQYSDRVQLTQECHDDRREPVARRD